MYVKNNPYTIRPILLMFIFFQLNFAYSVKVNLKSTDNQADYLVITTDNFSGHLDELLNLRESQGLNIKTIITDSIYHQFGDTLSKQDAIKSFVSYALEYWSDPKPQYLLLVGDVEYVPSYKVQSQFHDTELNEDSVSIDDQFAINMYENDHFPDIAIGRLPVTNNQELENIIEKISLFENNLKRENYTKDYLGLADFRNNEYIFEQIQKKLTENILPDYYTYQRIDRRSESDYYGVKKDILKILEQGSLFLYYSGHGSPFIWADTSFLQVDDIESLDPNGLPVIFTAVACKQSFDIPDSVTITEALIRKKDGGTVTSFAPSGLAYAYQGSQIMESFFKKLFDKPDQTIGNIILQVKQEQSIGFAKDDITLRYTLLGDPALKFPSDIIAGIPEPDPDILTGFELFQNYPNPFNPKTTIRYSVGAIHESPLQKINLSIYNILGQKVVTLVEGLKSAGTYSVTWSPGDIPSGIYLIRLNSGRFTQTIRTLYIK